MTVHELAGKPAPPALRINVDRLVNAYYNRRPDVAEENHRIVFGTSGHRGSSLTHNFNEGHILAVTQAICDHRRRNDIRGPLFLGKDTHALSEPSFASAVEVLCANEVDTFVDHALAYTPTPVISHAILNWNRDHETAKADGIVITPSHNPPEDGGFKYNPPHGGPAGTQVTRWVAERANEILAADNRAVKRIPFETASRSDSVKRHDFIAAYVADLDRVLDLEIIRAAGVRMGVDPMGGAAVAVWEPLAERWKLDIEVVNPEVDPAFGFMPVDWDGKIRMDCSSPYAMAGMVALKDRFDIAFGNDPDADRHGIVTPSSGLLTPNHYLAVAIDYLFRHRSAWPASVAVGKTLVSSSMIDRVAAGLDRRLAEVPVGFKWFVDGLLTGEYGFAGEESAGASFLRRDGTVWTTDKDGIIMNLLAAEVTARTGQDPAAHYAALTRRFGQPVYQRIDAPATAAQKTVLAGLSAEQVAGDTLAGERIVAKMTRAPCGAAPIGGLKVVTANGWFAARPSGTESIYKIYAESFRGRDHLRRIQDQAKDMVTEAFARAGLANG